MYNEGSKEGYEQAFKKLLEPAEEPTPYATIGDFDLVVSDGSLAYYGPMEQTAGQITGNDIIQWVQEIRGEGIKGIVSTGGINSYARTLSNGEWDTDSVEGDRKTAKEYYSKASVVVGKRTAPENELEIAVGMVLSEEKSFGRGK